MLSEYSDLGIEGVDLEHDVKYRKKIEKIRENKKLCLLSLWICNIMKAITNCLYTIYLYNGEGILLYSRV